MLNNPLLTKNFLRKFGFRYDNLINWKKILKGEDREFYLNKKNKKDKKKILIATSTGGHLACAHFDSVLAFALTLEDWDVEILLCDKSLSACQQSTTHLIKEEEFIEDGPKKLCNACFDSGRMIFDGLDLKVLKFSDFLNQEIENQIKFDLKDYNQIKFEDLKVDKFVKEHAKAGALRFYAVGDLNNEKHHKEVLYNYLFSALKTKYSFENIIKKQNYHSVILNHGVYVPQGIINNVAKKNELNVVCYSPAYKKNSFTLSHDDTYHITMMNENTNLWENLEWNERLDKRLMDYLYSRRFGKNDWEYYFSKPDFDYEDKFKKYGIDLNKPVVGMLTNIIWDALLTYPSNIFVNMMEWIYLTIEYFSQREDLQLIIRVHPAEVKSDRISKQKVSDEIFKKYKTLPKNVFIIDSDDDLSTYSLTDICDSVLIYSTKMGMEFSPFGIPVICAGESYVRNKKITLDPKSKEEYNNMLNMIPFNKKLSEENILRAKKYAYHFFFRRMITIDSIKHAPLKWPPFTLDQKGVKKILEKKDNGLNQICSSIKNNSPFILKDENLI